MIGPLVVEAASWSYVVVAGGVIALGRPLLMVALVLLDRRLR